MKKKTMEDLGALCLKYQIGFNYQPRKLFIKDYHCSKLVAIYDKHEGLYIGDPELKKVYTFEELRQHFKIVQKHRKENK